jgi:uncharacterized protein YkuJ
LQLHELEHLIRAAGEVTDRYEFVVVGSQAILGTYANAPQVFTLSNEADLYAFDSGDEVDVLSTAIDGAIGEGSPFHDMNNFYAQGVDPSTAKLPASWKARVVRLQSAATNGRVAYCISPVDLFLSKCAANREKDREFNIAMLEHDYVSVEEALALVPEMPLDAAGQKRVRALIGRLSRDATARAAAAKDSK